MNIVIVVHSQTGNTASVAQGLAEALTGAGHSVTVERLEAVGEIKPRDKDVQLKSTPDISGYEAMILGAPVHAFALSSVMQTYLQRLPSLEGKRVMCFVTQFFPFAWMGGKVAVRQMRKICSAKGAEVLDSGVVNWSRRSRARRVAEMVARFRDRLSI